jgi:hypothetical protein
MHMHRTVLFYQFLFCHLSHSGSGLYLSAMYMHYCPLQQASSVTKYAYRYSVHGPIKHMTRLQGLYPIEMDFIVFKENLIVLT